MEPLSTLEPINRLGVNSTHASPLLVVILGPICYYPTPVSVSGVIFVKPMAVGMLSHSHLNQKTLIKANEFVFGSN